MQFSSSDLPEFRRRIERMQGNASNLGPGLLKAGSFVAGAAMSRIEAGGPGWAPNKTGTPLLQRTGRLLNSLAPQNSVALTADGVRITAGTDYAEYLQNGTGIFAGHQPWKARWGRSIVTHQGMPPRPFLYIDEPVVAGVLKQLVGWVMRSEA
jgi:phage gpG-like protein